MAKPNKTFLLVQLTDAISCGVERNRDSIESFTSELLKEMTPWKLMEEVKNTMGNRVVPLKDRDRWIVIVYLLNARINSTILWVRPDFVGGKRIACPPPPPKQLLK